jgi:hypothetical protein
VVAGAVDGLEGRIGVLRSGALVELEETLVSGGGLVRVVARVVGRGPPDLVVHPDAADPLDGTFAQGDREICEVVVADLGRAAAPAEALPADRLL